MIMYYAKFCNVYFTGLPVFPSTQSMLTRFIAYLFLQKFSPSTIASYISAIGFGHKARMLSDPTSSFIVKKILKGAEKLKVKVDCRLPITGEILVRLVNAIPLVISNLYFQSLMRAMFLIAFYAFLRIGEITVSKQKDRSKVLQISNTNFSFHCNKLFGVSLVLTQYKHSEAHPKTLSILRDEQNLYCPVMALKSYLDLSQHTSGPLFQFPDGDAVTHNYFSSTLRSILQFCNFDPNLYKGHSFRIGAATVAASKGIPLSVIQNMGRWKSDALKHYIRLNNFKLS